MILGWKPGWYSFLFFPPLRALIWPEMDLINESSSRRRAPSHTSSNWHGASNVWILAWRMASRCFHNHQEIIFIWLSLFLDPFRFIRAHATISDSVMIPAICDLVYPLQNDRWNTSSYRSHWGYRNSNRLNQKPWKSPFIVSKYLTDRHKFWRDSLNGKEAFINELRPLVGQKRTTMLSQVGGS